MSEYPKAPDSSVTLFMKVRAAETSGGLSLRVRGVLMSHAEQTIADTTLRLLLLADCPDGSRVELGVVTHPYELTISRSLLPSSGWVCLTGEVIRGAPDNRFLSNPYYLGGGGSPKVPLPGMNNKSTKYDVGCADWLTSITRFTRPTLPPYQLKPLPSQNGVAPTRWVSERPWGNGVHAVETHPRWRRIGGQVQAEALVGGAGSAKLSEIIDTRPGWPTVGGEPGVSCVTPITTVHGHPSGGRGPLYIGLDGYGRFWGYNRDGTITGMGGNEMPPDNYEIPDETLSTWRPVGTFFDGPLLYPNDFCYDYENRKWIYVADTGNNRLVRIDRRTVAGQLEDFRRWEFRRWGQAFKYPTSINSLHNFGLVVVDADGLWRVDKATGNGTLVFRHSDLFWCSFLSTGEVCVISRTSVIYRVNIQTGAVVQLADLGKRHEWNLISPDIGGHIGPKDALYVINGHYASYRVDQDGTVHGTPTVGPYYFREKGGYFTVGDLRLCVEMHHYSWNMEVHQEEPYVFNNSQSWTMPNLVRPMQPGEEYMQEISHLANVGRYIMRRGTIEGFPWGARPSFSSLMSSHGYSGLGVKMFDEIQGMPLTERIAYVKSGMGGSVSRPELVGDHLRGLLYWIWRNSRQFIAGVPMDIPAPNTDTGSPLISDVRVVKSGTQLTWTWRTDRPTLCYVRFGDRVPMYRFTAVENDFTTTHTAVAKYVDGAVHYQICALGQNGVISLSTLAGSDGPQDTTPPRAPTRLRAL
jgi:hypothetical protein